LTRKAFASLVDYEAELAVIGGVLIKPEMLPLLNLDRDDFHGVDHGHVWGAMRNLEAAGHPVDVVSVADQLERDRHFETSASLLGEAALNVPTPENVEHYASILRRHRIGRQVDDCLRVIRAKLELGTIDGPDALIETQAQLARIQSGESDDRAKSLGAIVRGINEEIANGSVAPPCMKTGLKKLDDKTGGIPFGVPSFVLAPPGSGKSTLALTFCEGAELQGDTPLLYSYEDGHRSFGLRTMARHSGVPTEKLRTASADDFALDDFNAISRHMAEMLQRRTIVIRAGGMTVDELIRDVRARRLRHKGNGTTGKLVCVDYVQLVPLPNVFSGTVNDRMGEVVKRLAEFASNENIAIVVFSQVGRQVPKEARPPSLADARDCGVIEMVAKLMIGLFRPGVYKQPASDSLDSKTKTTAPLSLLELHIIKNNQGESGRYADVYWDLATHTIVNSRDDLHGRRNS
jgi:replicative DNA helicase